MIIKLFFFFNILQLATLTCLVIESSLSLNNKIKHFFTKVFRGRPEIKLYLLIINSTSFPLKILTIISASLIALTNFFMEKEQWIQYNYIFATLNNISIGLVSGIVVFFLTSHFDSFRDKSSIYIGLSEKFIKIINLRLKAEASFVPSNEANEKNKTDYFVKKLTTIRKKSTLDFYAYVSRFSLYDLKSLIAFNKELDEVKNQCHLIDYEIRLSVLTLSERTQAVIDILEKFKPSEFDRDFFKEANEWNLKEVYDFAQQTDQNISNVDFLFKNEKKIMANQQILSKVELSYEALCLIFDFIIAREHLEKKFNKIALPAIECVRTVSHTVVNPDIE